MTTSEMIIGIAYVFATAGFILSLHWLSDPKTARNGVMSGVIAMAIADAVVGPG